MSYVKQINALILRFTLAGVREVLYAGILPPLHIVCPESCGKGGFFAKRGGLR